MHTIERILSTLVSDSKMLKHVQRVFTRWFSTFEVHGMRAEADDAWLVVPGKK